MSIPLHKWRAASGRHVCFDCRVCYHKVTYVDGSPCAQCKKPLKFVGVHFRAPKKRDKRAWAVLELLVQDGMRFGCSGGNGLLPETVAEALMKRKRKHAAWILAIRKHNGKRVPTKDTGFFSNAYRLPV